MLFLFITTELRKISDVYLCNRRIWPKRTCICWPRSSRLDWWMQILTISTISRATEICVAADPQLKKTLSSHLQQIVDNETQSSCSWKPQWIWDFVYHCVSDYQKSRYSCTPSRFSMINGKYALCSGQTASLGQLGRSAALSRGEIIVLKW